MSMNGIDISSYQGDLNLNNISYDFVLIKATEGNGYVNPVCDTHFQEAKAAGKKRAVYHFYDFGVDAIVQADYFVDNCAGYIRDAIFVLDWEGQGVADVVAALRFLQHVEARTGYKPAIYMSEWVENAYDWSAVVANDNGLWAAKYADYEIDNNYDMSNAGKQPNVTHWPFYFMWQWTSKGHLNGYAGDLDCDIFYGDGGTWDAYAGVQAAPVTPAPAPTPDPIPAPVVPEPVTPPTPVVDVPAPVVPVVAPVVPEQPIVVAPPVVAPSVPTKIVVTDQPKTTGLTLNKVKADISLLTQIVSIFNKISGGTITALKKSVDNTTITGRTIRTFLQAGAGLMFFVATVLSLPDFATLMSSNGFLELGTITTYVTVSTFIFNTIEQFLSWLNTD